MYSIGHLAMFYNGTAKIAIAEEIIIALLFSIAKGNLSLSLLMTTQVAFVDSVDQDQTAQNMQSDL